MSLKEALQETSLDLGTGVSSHITNSNYKGGDDNGDDTVKQFNPCFDIYSQTSYLTSLSLDSLSYGTYLSEL